MLSIELVPVEFYGRIRIGAEGPSSKSSSTAGAKGACCRRHAEIVAATSKVTRAADAPMTPSKVGIDPDDTEEAAGTVSLA